MSTFRQALADNPRLIAQLAWVYDREATAMEVQARKDGTLDEAKCREIADLRDVACEYEAAAMNEGYVGYPFGDEV